MPLSSSAFAFVKDHCFLEQLLRRQRHSVGGKHESNDSALPGILWDPAFLRRA